MLDGCYDNKKSVLTCKNERVSFAWSLAGTQRTQGGVVARDPGRQVYFAKSHRLGPGFRGGRF